MNIDQLRRQTGMVIPVYFEPQVDEGAIRAILEQTFQQHRLFCCVENTVLVVDRGTAAERVLSGAQRGSPLDGLPLLFREHNRGKAGAIRAGLERLLREQGLDYLVTRDCDGDGALEDLTALVGLLAQLRQRYSAAAVLGARPVLFKSMNWEREQWELLINRVVEAMVDFGLAARDRVQDRTAWNGLDLDLQGGFRVYDREAARLAIAALERIPDDPELYLLACEILPYPEITFQGGVLGQVLRRTVTEQAVSSFSRLPFARCYGRLLRYMALEAGISMAALVQMFDNALVELPGYFSNLRPHLLECRACLDPEAAAPQPPRLT